MAPSQRPLTTATDAVHHLLGMVEAFRAFDSDGDGLTTAEELGGILSSLGYNASEHEVRDMMNGAGLLGLEEFIAMNARELDLGNLVSQLQAVLLELGPEGNEEVTGEELYDALMGGLGYEECMGIIAAMDRDGVGSVSVEDLGVIVQALL